MTPERWARINEVFGAALEMPEADRRAYLESACGGDADLRSEVERRLADIEDESLRSPAADLLAEAAELAPGEMLRQYRVEAKLGEGGMGAVYRAYDTSLERPVALKVLLPEQLSDPDHKQRLMREARAASALNHPNIVTVYEVGFERGLDFIAMEYVEGQSLAQLIPAKGLPVKRALECAIQIADGLAKAHAAGIVHRDLKPGNVMVNEAGRIKLLDFGLARRVHLPLEGKTASLTVEGEIAGTPAYMAPEQAEGKKADQRSDVFALGAVLYEMLSGRRAFRGESMGATLAAVIAFEPPPLKEAPPEVARIVGKMLAKNRESRYQSVEKLLVDLEAAAAGAGLISRRLWLALAAALVVLIALVAGFDVRGWRTRLVTWTRAPAPSIRLAVLPFANLSGDPEQEYLSDGLTQEMITQLGSLHPASLSVIARTSVMRYKKSEKSLGEIARELNVDYILEGSARREGGRIRITAELIQARSQTQLWAQSFERELAGVLALQSEVSKKVASSLALKLLPTQQALLANVRTVNPEAHDAYLRGLQHWHRLTPGDLDSAEKYFELALTKDPNYAPAYAGISLVWGGRQQMGYVPPSEAGPKAKAAAESSVALDEAIAEGHYVLALIKTWTDWDWAGAEPEFKRAIEINPSFPDARAYYSHFLMTLRRPEEAMLQMERALELDPFNALFQSLYAVDLLYARRYDDAIDQCRKALRTSPDSPVAVVILPSVLFNKKMYKEALAGWKTYLNTAYGSEVERALEEGYTQAGYPGAMRYAAEALAARSRKTYTPPSDIAVLYLHAGQKVAALNWLERAFEVRDPNLPYMGGPDFDSLRSEPRYQALLRRMNLPQ